MLQYLAKNEEMDEQKGAFIFITYSLHQLLSRCLLCLWSVVLNVDNFKGFRSRSLSNLLFDVLVDDLS
jgi:hypothetical protein